MRLFLFSPFSELHLHGVSFSFAFQHLTCISVALTQLLTLSVKDGKKQFDMCEQVDFKAVIN